MSDDKIEALQNEGFALEASPEYWEDIKEALMAIVEGNEELDRRFQFIKKELDWSLD